jgi:hypothetical protein
MPHPYVSKEISQDRAELVQTANLSNMPQRRARPTHIGTKAAAAMLVVTEETMQKSHSQKGSYVGIRPVRLPSRKLAWPLAEIEKLLGVYREEE